jgi:cytochrome b561
MSRRESPAVVPAPDVYPLGLRLLHWTTAALLVAALASVLSRDLVESTVVDRLLLDAHRGFGATALVLALLRLAIRLGARVPRSDGVGPLLRAAAGAVQWSLYGLLLIVPLLGWAAASATGKPVSLFGLVTLPSLLGRDRGLAEDLEDIHGTAAWMLVALVGLHMAAALWHHFMRRDDTLATMLPAVRWLRAEEASS